MDHYKNGKNSSKSNKKATARRNAGQEAINEKAAEQDEALETPT